MTLYAGTIPPEVLSLVMEVVQDLKTAVGHLESNNYGLAKEWIEEALADLPTDETNGQGTRWGTLEERTYDGQYT